MKRFIKKINLYTWIMFKNIGLLFRPMTAILFSIIAMIVLNTPLCVWASNAEKGTTLRDILLAVITGVTASFLVAIVIEIAGNYRRNKQKDIELADYYGKLYSFEMKRLTMSGLSRYLPGLSDLIKHQNGDPDDSDNERSVDDMDNNDDPDNENDEVFQFNYDDIQILWKSFPQLMSVFQEVYHNRREYLSLKETEAIKYILSYYKNFIREYFKSELYSGIVESQFNEPDFDYLKSEFPESLLSNLSEEFKKALTMAEFETAFERMMEYIFTNDMVFYEAFDDITVGADLISDGNEETDYSDDSAFKSSHFSSILQNIMEQVLVLEKEAMKYPSGYLLHIARKKCKTAQRLKDKEKIKKDNIIASDKG